MTFTTLLREDSDLADTRIHVIASLSVDGAKARLSKLELSVDGRRLSQTTDPFATCDLAQAEVVVALLGKVVGNAKSVAEKLREVTA